MKEAGEAALPGVTGTAAPKELTASHRPTPTAPPHRNKSLEESAKATELPPKTPPKADCRASKGREGHAGVMGVEEKVNREAIYLQQYEESSGEVFGRITGRIRPHAARWRECRQAAAR